MEQEKPVVTIYTDGAAEPNPGPGGYGVVLLFGKHRKELSCGFELTTNNRMELLAVIAGLEALTKPCSVTVYSDSKYVVDSVENGSVFEWRSKNWFRTKSERAKNSDLWERFIAAYESHAVTLKWVPGHSGIAENERCDELAVAAAKSLQRFPDIGYQPNQESKVTHTQPGEPCRKCGTELIRQTAKEKRRKPGEWYYEWYLYCAGCKATYTVESAKRQCESSMLTMFDDD